MNYGFIYCLGNECMPGTYKIGMTERSPMQRCQEISGSTGVPQGFDLLCYGEVENPQQIEKKIHLELDENRVSPSREFFYADYNFIEDSIRSYSINFTETERGSFITYCDHIYKSFINATTDEEKVIYYKVLASLNGLEIYKENNEILIKGDYTSKNIVVRSFLPFIHSTLSEQLSLNKMPYLTNKGLNLKVESKYFIVASPKHLINDDVRLYIKAFKHELINELLEESKTNITPLAKVQEEGL